MRPRAHWLLGIAACAAPGLLGCGASTAESGGFATATEPASYGRMVLTAAPEMIVRRIGRGPSFSITTGTPYETHGRRNVDLRLRIEAYERPEGALATSRTEQVAIAWTWASCSGGTYMVAYGRLNRRTDRVLVRVRGRWRDLRRAPWPVRGESAAHAQLIYTALPFRASALEVLGPNGAMLARRVFSASSSRHSRCAGSAGNLRVP
jgi:hypothetical protein